MDNCILAYVDPATGSLILQAVLGVFVGAGVFFRRNLGQLFMFLSFRKGGGKSTDSTS